MNIFSIDSASKQISWPKHVIKLFGRFAVPIYTWPHQFVFITWYSFYFLYFCWVYSSLIKKFFLKILSQWKIFVQDLPILSDLSLSSLLISCCILLTLHYFEHRFCSYLSLFLLISSWEPTCKIFTKKLYNLIRIW